MDHVVEFVSWNLGTQSNFVEFRDSRIFMDFHVPMIVFLYKEALFNTNQLDTSFPSSTVSLFRNLKMSFSRKFRKGYLLSEGSNINLILYLVLPL